MARLVQAMTTVPVGLDPALSLLVADALEQMAELALGGEMPWSHVTLEGALAWIALDDAPAAG